MSQQPVLLISRKLSKSTELRASKSYDVRLNLEDKVYSPEELLRECQDVDAVLACHSEYFSANLVSQLPGRLKIIANHSVGVDHCDLTALKEKGIVVTNTPDVLSDATAEIAVLLMLGAARRASEGDQLVRSGKWEHWSPSFMVGTQVTGKRLGIVGMGRVGQIMSKRARGFDMEVHYHNRNRLSPEMEGGAIFHEDLDSLLSVSQFLSLHCPATSETIGFLTKDKIDLLPKGAIFINTSRGALVDEEALIAALKSGKIAGAGLDVYLQEPGGNPDISSLNNVFMLPHIGSATFETRDAMGFRALDNLDSFFAGKEPKDCVA